MNRRWEIARYAYENVALYRERCEKNSDIKKMLELEKWESIPLVEKRDIVFSGSKAISDEYIGQYALGKLLKTHTSGTAGISVDTYWTKQDYYCSLLPLWIQRWKNAGIHPKDKVCFFNTVLLDNKNYLFEKNTLIISKSNMTRERLRKSYELMRKFEPKWLLLHPSMAMMLCEIVEKEKLPAIPTLVYMELTGEMFLESQRVRLEKLFSCIVKSHYGAMEVNSMGYEEEKGKYRLFETAAYVEILDDNGKVLKNGEEGNIYVTSLHNYAMPFIRYGIGDCGKIVTECDGGKKSRILQLSDTRKNDLFYLEEGAGIPPDGLLKPVDIINSMEDYAVYQFRAVQVEYRTIEIYAILNGDFDKQSFMNHYMKLLEPAFSKGIQYRFIFQDEDMFPDKITGKLGWFESKCK